MRTSLLLASRNAHKTREFAQLLGANFSLRYLSSQTDAPEIVEAGKTFEENAVVKAVTISRLFPGELVIADDSGLEVDALGGAPGIFSARYVGARATDRENIEKLIGEIRRSQTAATGWQSHSADFSAKFRCVIALAKGGQLLTSANGEIEGSIITLPRGTNGFGYDPVFVPRGLNQTFAELPAELKNRISHRARAVRKLAAFLRTARRSS